jgi:hypothetical protein
MSYSPITTEMYEVLTLEGRMKLLDYVYKDLMQYNETLEYKLELANLEDELSDTIYNLLNKV